MIQDDMIKTISEEDMFHIFDDIEKYLAPIQAETKKEKKASGKNWKKGDFLSKRGKI